MKKNDVCAAKTTVSIEIVEACLAGTQCTQCGYNGCKPYAKAIVEAGESINKCRPGGMRVIKKLAHVLDTNVIEPAEESYPPTIAVVEEDLCIGCTKCQQVCPTDAILGAPKLKHQVLFDDCTGCRLCVPVCPTDCIVLEETNIPQDIEARQLEIVTLVKAKQQRTDGDLMRDITALGEKVNIEVPTLQLDETVAAKVAEARAASKTKWTEKKKPVLPKVLAGKEKSGTT